MDLAPGERQALALIESQLSTTDPRLEAMLTGWTTRRLWLLGVSVPSWSKRRLVGLAAVLTGLALIVSVATAGVLTMLALS
jgi:hypothetical protein